MCSNDLLLSGSFSVERLIQVYLNHSLMKFTRLKGHATNYYGFTSKNSGFIGLYSTCFSLIFVSDVFMALKNHHLQLEILASRLSF